MDGRRGVVDQHHEIELRIVGVLGDYGRSLFPGFDQVIEPAITVLRGRVRDEAELDAIRQRVRDAGLELVSLRRILLLDEGWPRSPGWGEAQLPPPA